MSVETAGFSSSMAIYLIALINAGSIPGRILPGWLADKLGFFNVMVIISSLTGISILALWIPFDYHPSHAGIMVFAVIYGFVSGGFISLLMPCAAKSGDVKSLGQRFGTFQLVMAVSSLTGLPIQGAILTREGSYLGLQLFAAISMIFGTLLVAFSRYTMVGGSLSKKV
ncbi:transporter MCH4-like protein 8 [Phlyctema vagabunda]|uniref:Transporter MCH4-like protein 8 n=1 Tax=Phlyctema vagabunda TaxID=108571 RepID=A0ABR4PH86_9HELO